MKSDHLSLPSPQSTLVLAIAVSVWLTVASADSNNFRVLEQYIPYSYSGATGPGHWGSLNPSYSACSSGKAQSPINIDTKYVVYNPKLHQLSGNYTATNATLINNGFNIGMWYGNGGTSIIDGKTYTLKQMHWHTPSEHTIDGQRFAAELHLFHVSSDGSLAVVAVLYEYGKADQLLYRIKDGLNELIKETYGGDQQAHVPVSLKTRHLGKRSKKYFRYMGSLTVPPCSENVSWTILTKVREIAKEQVEALKAPLGSSFKNNSRPLQVMNGRKVQLYNNFLNI